MSPGKNADYTNTIFSGGSLRTDQGQILYSRTDESVVLLPAMEEDSYREVPS